MLVRPSRYGNVQAPHCVPAEYQPAHEKWQGAPEGDCSDRRGPGMTYKPNHNPDHADLAERAGVQYVATESGFVWLTEPRTKSTFVINAHELSLPMIAVKMREVRARFGLED